MLITEEFLKQEFNLGNIKSKGSFILKDNQILTPSAKSFLNEKGIAVVKEQISENNNQKYTTIFGAVLDHKPEHMTHLKGNTLVFKNHPVIAFRGEIDYLQSEIILVQDFAIKNSLKALSDELEEVMKFLQFVIRCEITGEKIDNYKLLGMDWEEIRQKSHHPSQYYGIKHFIPSIKQGEVPAYLNRLRTLARKAELSAYDAFTDRFGQCCREDIIMAMNRLSSLFWIMMFKYIAKLY